MNTAFLFGAGASYGSDAVGTPPLGATLFTELGRFNPDGWGTVSGDLAEEFANDFERAITKLSPHALPPLQRAMAAYFFQFTPRRSSLYVQLAARSRETGWKGVFCTLNYERLLELALSASGIRPFVGEPRGSGLEICLPHGCCHLFCDSVRGMPSGVSFAGAAVKTNGPITVISDPRAHRDRITRDAFPPVMSYFEPQKQTTSGASFIDAQRARWSAHVSRADTLIIVGVHPRPHDRHIWDRVASCSGRVVYCGGPAGATQFAQWQSKYRPERDDRIMNGYFDDEFESICDEAGL